MGLPISPAAEGVLPVLVMNTVLSVALLMNMVRSVLKVLVGPSSTDSGEGGPPMCEADESGRRVSITSFKSLCEKNGTPEEEEEEAGGPPLSRSGSSNCGCGGSVLSSIMECCVCLCRFEAEEEVSELSCKHFFHKACLQKWFRNYHHSTCPLCRSIL